MAATVGRITAAIKPEVAVETKATKTMAAAVMEVATIASIDDQAMVAAVVFLTVTMAAVVTLLTSSGTLTTDRFRQMWHPRLKVSTATVPLQ